MVTDKQITEITHSFVQSTSMSNSFAENEKVGKNGVIKITEHIPMGALEKHYFEVDYDNGFTKMVFEPYEVIYKTDSR